MGVYCSLCGLPLNPKHSPEIKKWIYNHTILYSCNRVVHNSNQDPVDITSLDNHKSFLAIHTDCWKYIKREKNVELRYSDFPMVKKLYSGEDFFFFNIYLKPTTTYIGQDINIIKYSNQGVVIDSPLKNDLLGKFIDHIFKKIDIKVNRKSPRVSSTLYEEGDLLIGADNNFWQIKKNKWTKVNTFKDKFIINIEMNNENEEYLKSIYNHFNYKYIKDKYKNLKLFKIPRLGEVSKINLVLEDIHFFIHKNNCQIIINGIYTDKGLKKLNNLVKKNFYIQEMNSS
jgi:hypothetical protein